jgi:hypothetical protein
MLIWRGRASLAETLGANKSGPEGGGSWTGKNALLTLGLATLTRTRTRTTRTRTRYRRIIEPRHV